MISHPLARRAGAALLGLALLAGAAPLRSQPQPFRTDFSVVHINDVYRIDAVDDGVRGGLGRVVTLARQTRERTRRPVYSMLAGDFIAPSLESRYFAGAQMIDALNFLHARAPLFVVPGNHEFDERRGEMLAGAVRASRFPWIAANATFHTGDAAVDARLARDTIVEMGGVRVGIVALTMIDAPRDYVRVDTAYVRIADERIGALSARGAEAIVALTHLDIEDDRRIARLRARHPRLLWVAGGHEHFLQQEPLTDSTAMITKGDSNARRVWVVHFGRAAGGVAVRADSVRLEAPIAVDREYGRAVVEPWRARLVERVPFFDQRIGRSETVLDGTETTVRDAESNWGSWLADVMRAAYPSIHTDAAVLNGGAIRIDDTFSGDVRWEHLARTFGFPTRVAIVWLRGRDVRERLLEQSVSGARGEGRFLQVSGLRFAFDRALPVGRRVSEVEVRREAAWEPLRDEQVYAVAVPDYLFGGGDGYRFTERAVMSVPPGPELRLLAFEALADALARGEAIAPRVEGRIRARR